MKVTVTQPCTTFFLGVKMYEAETRKIVVPSKQSIEGKKLEKKKRRNN
jgi:hypothetical protein